MTIASLSPSRMWAAPLAVATIFALCLSAGSWASGPAAAAAQKEDKKEKEKMWTKTDSGLQYREIKEGTGAKAEKGMTCFVHYTGRLWVDGAKGEKFDSSRDRGQPIDFQLGAGDVIKGWDEGVAGMKVGGKRELLIPPDLGYGARGIGGLIPPDATLFFEVELMKVQ